MKIQDERTFVMIKPDGVQRSLIGEIIQRIERTGLKLVALKFLVPDQETVRKHYTIDPEWIEKVGTKSIAAYDKKGIEPPSRDPHEAGDRVLKVLLKYLSSGPVVAMVWQGAHAQAVVKKITGGTEPLTSDVGTIRGDFVIDSYQIADMDGREVRNLLHVSTSPEEADLEIKIWFTDDELIKYRLIQEQILYDVNLDGILE